MSALTTTESQRRLARAVAVSLALAVLACACGASPAEPAKAAPDSILLWGHPWSIFNFLGFALTTYLAWEFSYYFFFRKRLETPRPSAPWPRDAFALSMAVFSSLTVLVFLFWFAVVSTALRGHTFHIFTKNVGYLQFLNVHWIWITLLLLNVGIFWLNLVLWRRPRPQRAR